MYALEPTPAWRAIATNGYCSPPDREWFYHFRVGGYESILQIEIEVENPAQRELIRAALKRVHVPGEETPDGFRVFGYLQDSQSADYM
jgi:hypothetical protein